MPLTLQDLHDHATDAGLIKDAPATPPDLMERARQDAERQRNYQNAFQGSSQMGRAGTSGGEGGAGTTYDPNAALPDVPWSGPSAYGMAASGAEYGQGNEAQMNADLARARKFDPNATLTRGTRTTGGEGGGTEQTYYTLNYDQSKLPKQRYPGAAQVGAYGSNESVWNDRGLAYDPNYGVVTDPRNLRGKNLGFDWLSLGPLAVAAFAGFGAPALAAMMSGGALGGAGAAGGAALSAAEAGAGGGAAGAGTGATAAATQLSPTMINLLTRTPFTIANLNNGGNPYAALLGTAGAATGIPFAGTAGSLIGNQIKNPNRPGGG